jgi:2-iminobutanoate/2-iminopropanoate deaminase
MREKVETKGAPQAIGPYSQAIRVMGSEMLFCSGQIPLDPATGGIVGNTPAEQTVRVMENLKASLKQVDLR